MSDKYPKTPLPEDVFRIPTKEEALADGIKKEFLKYQEKQKKVCNAMHGLTISDCSIFAVGDATWDQYGRRNLLEQYQLDFDPKLFTNRICLNSIYENWNLFEHYANITEI